MQIGFIRWAFVSIETPSMVTSAHEKKLSDPTTLCEQVIEIDESTHTPNQLKNWPDELYVRMRVLYACVGYKYRSNERQTARFPKLPH